MTYRSPAAPNLHLILFSWCCLPSQMGRRGHRRGREVPHPWRNSTRAPNNPNPFSRTARRRNDRLFPRRSENIYAEETCGRENTIRWDTNCAFALIFFPPFFVLSLAGPNSLQSAPAEAVQNLWNKASPQLRRRENPCGMRDDIPKEQILYFYPCGPALVPLGAVSPSEIHLLQGASAPTMGNKS